MHLIAHLYPLSISIGLFFCFAMPAHAQSDSIGSPTRFNNANAPFKSNLSFQGISFAISSPNHNKDNAVFVTPKGLQGDNASISVIVDGKVTGAEIADLNSDGFPEIYIFVNSNDASKKGSLLAYASNRNKSITPIYLPPLSEDQKAMNNYAGQDEFAVVENALERRFRIAGQDKSYRQIQYKLKAGEAGWVLVKTRITDF